MNFVAGFLVYFKYRSLERLPQQVQSLCLQLTVSVLWCKVWVRSAGLVMADKHHNSARTKKHLSEAFTMNKEKKRRFFP
jgi:hypothetical protein